MTVAARCVNRTTFRSKPESARRKTVADYLKLKGADSPIDENKLALETDRIGVAQPEMCIFKFFKTALANSLLGKQVTPEAEEIYVDFAEGGSKRKAPKVNPQSVARAEYDAVFGEGAYADLQSTSTLMPARDMARTIDRFWHLEGSQFGLDVSQIEYIDDTKREEILIDILVDIADKVYAAIPTENRPTRATPEDIAQRFMPDLIHPSPELDLDELIAQQMQAYGETKANARKDKGLHLCPICNGQFDGGTKAKADFVGNPEGHTNRGISHGRAGQIVICDTCKYERFLQQLLLGSQVTDLLVLFPRMNIGHSSGEVFRQKAIQIWDKASIRMTEANPNPDLHLSFGLTYNLAQKLGNYDVYQLTPDEIVEVITYESRTDTKKRNRRDLEKELKTIYGMEELRLDEINELWDTDFTTIEAAVQALIDGKVRDEEARDIRTKAFRLNRQFYIACQTPHMILVPLTNPVSIGDESDTNAGLRELYLTLILGLSLDCSVAVVKARGTNNL